MRPREIDEPSTQGQDSFLDVVANMVGIIILLVMIVGLRASQLPAVAPSTSEVGATLTRPGTPSSDLLSRELAELDDEIAELAQQVAETIQEEKLREVERVHLASSATLARQELERRKTAMDEAQRAEHELLHGLTVARSRLDELAQAQLAIPRQSPEVEKIENLSTPLARTVKGEELHLRLADGMVSVIPLDELVAGLEEHVRGNVWKLAGQDSFEETLGTTGGYRLRYRIIQRRVVVQSAAGPINQGSTVELDKWELVPVAEDLGQSVDQSLLPDSELRRALAGRRPETTTVTIWTYPDSFTAFRTLKKALFEMGFATAARPLPEGALIGGSPRGSKSAAE